MKKRIIAPALIAVSLSVAAFAPGDRSEISYSEIGSGDPVLVSDVSSFTKYEQSHESADKTLWTKRNEKWDITPGTSFVSQIEQSLNNN